MTNQTTQIPGYDRDAVTIEDVRKFRKEAERRGHCYQLRIDGNPDPKGEGILFKAESDEEAKCWAYGTAWRRSCTLDCIDLVRGVQYPTHAYQLYHQGRLLVDYKPPNPENVKSGKVVMPLVDEVTSRFP